MEKRAVLKNYGLLGAMLAAMLTGGVTGWLWPAAAGTVRPLGQIFINLMFCVVVPLVFSSIAGAIAGMRSVRRAGRIMGVTVLTFVVTGILAAVLMFLLMKAFPPVLTPWQSLPTEAVGDYAAPGQLLVNFFTAEDFVGLLSRRAMLPLIVFSVLLGFAANLTGGPDGPVARGLTAVTQVMMQLIRLLTYYAPVAFFAIFAGLVADYGPKIAGAYGRAMAVYYPLCFMYLFTAFPLMARLGGGRGGVGIMLRHIARPALTSLGTCSSVATIPANLEAAEDTGISRDVAEMVIPLGATMHMDGSCFSCVLKIAFVWGVFGQELTWGKLLPIVAVAVLSSVGMSGVPGGGYWCDMGDCGAYLDCAADVLSGKVKLDMGLPQQSPGVWSAQPIPEGVTVIPPCWLGPGAAVEPGALIGPHTVLEQNSWVGRRSLVQRSVLLPGARAEERTTLYGAILCKGAAARPEAVLNEGTVLGERALAEEKAVLLEGVRLWPARVAPAGTRLSRSITSSGRREPLLFGDGGVIRGVLGEDLGPEALMTIGGVLGCSGAV